MRAVCGVHRAAVSAPWTRANSLNSDGRRNRRSPLRCGGLAGVFLPSNGHFGLGSRESVKEEQTMATEPFEQFAIPNELRSFAEQSVVQARKAFEGFLQAANQAVGQIHGQAQAAHSGASAIAQKSMDYAEKNVAAAFDFAQKLMQAKDAAEIMGLQSEYLGRQMQALSAQVQDLGQSAAKIVMDAAKSGR
jgi:phasin